MGGFLLTIGIGVAETLALEAKTDVTNMANTDEMLEELLKEDDTSTEEKKEEKQNPDEISALLREKKKLITDIKALRSARRKETIEAQAEPKQETPAEEQKSQPEVDPLQTTEGWLDRINKTSQEAVTPVKKTLDDLVSVQKKKAIASFISNHPEYSEKSDPDGVKMKTVLNRYNQIKTRSDIDSDEIIEDLEDAWAIENRSVILQKEKKIRELESYAEESAAAIAATGGAYRENDSAETSSARSSMSVGFQEARRNMPGLTIEKYNDYLKQLSAMSTEEL